MRVVVLVGVSLLGDLPRALGVHETDAWTAETEGRRFSYRVAFALSRLRAGTPVSNVLRHFVEPLLLATLPSMTLDALTATERGVPDLFLFGAGGVGAVDELLRRKLVGRDRDDLLSFGPFHVDLEEIAGSQFEELISA